MAERLSKHLCTDHSGGAKALRINELPSSPAHFRVRPHTGILFLLPQLNHRLATVVLSLEPDPSNEV